MLKNLLMDNCLECSDVWHGISLGQGNSSVFKWSPWGHKCLRPKGT